MVWAVVLAESAAALEWLSYSHCGLLWLMGQASAALLMDWRRHGGAGVFPWRPEWLVLHAAAAAVWMIGEFTELLRFVAGAAAFGTLALAVLGTPNLGAWRRVTYWAGTAVGACAAAAGFAVIILVQMLWWGGIGSATIGAVTLLLRSFDPDAGATGGRLQAFGFSVTIAPACSGFEGMVLIGVFTAGWLIWFRREYRFPRALVLIPVGIALSWCLNVVRLAALMWIGSVAGRSVALGGFHSQAGWIMFTALAIALCAASLQVKALRKQGPAASESPRLPVTAWLTPFVAIQAAAMLSAAARTDFEWLYPLRTIAGAAAIGWYWKQIPRPKFEVWPVAAGTVIAMLWAAAAIFHPPVADSFGSLGEPWRAGWIAMRVVGAVAVVPVAEELAFRGIIQPQFGLIVSSVSFGLLHGSRWLPGILAGVALGWLKGRIGLGGCMTAHATANLLLLILIWISGDWRYWGGKLRHRLGREAAGDPVKMLLAIMA